MCAECCAYGPIGRSTENVENAKAVARVAALRRYTPPIRPLTLEEAYEADHCYIEFDTKGSSEPRVVLLVMMTAKSQNKKRVEVLEFGEDEGYCRKLDCNDYGKTWRCWERKPTEQEMREAEWEK